MTGGGIGASTARGTKDRRGRVVASGSTHRDAAAGGAHARCERRDGGGDEGGGHVGEARAPWGAARGSDRARVSATAGHKKAIPQMIKPLRAARQHGRRRLARSGNG